ncbi:indolepyruvate oxidoreductase subunit beta [Dehalogenimonas sp. THU2]|uniref:indolepyruvate oxidoreductase subunit beta n=1 Tax=Dehalogenimonas sp. THU2 TaxID=3151121 RepID=UPI0032186137
MTGQNIVIVGVGGQGVVLASNLLAEAALASGCDVKKTDTLGMAQRGGSVVSHLRYGRSVASPLIPEGGADILIAFEKLEAARWAHFIKPDGTVIVNDLALPPLSVTLGADTYPSDTEIAAMIRRYTPGLNVVNGTATAEGLGNAKMVNTVLLGYAARFIDIDSRLLLSTIEAALPVKLRKANVSAFEAGQKLSPLTV